jgi:hypothetical protein
MVRASRLLRFGLPLTVAAIAAPHAFGQTEPPKSGLSGLLSKAISSGKAGTNKAATHFKPSGNRLVLATYVNSLTESADERKALTEVFEKLFTEYEKAVEGIGKSNDITPAMAYAVSQCWEIWKGTPVPDKNTEALYEQLRGVLETPEVAKLSDTDKQKLYETTLLSVFTVQFTQVATANDAEAKKGVTTLAQATLQSLLGTSPDKVRLTEKGLEAVGGATATTPPPAAASTGGASALASYTIPSGYTKKVYSNGVALSGLIPDGNRKHDCEIRILPVRPAPGGAAKAFQDLWKETFAGYQAGEVSTAYRRVFPCKAVANYMGGFYKIKDKEQRVYTVLYVFDLGNKVQPVIASVVAGRAHEYDEPEAGGYQTLVKGLSVFLDSMKFASAPPLPVSLFTRAEVVGKWGESTSSMVVGGYYVTRSGDYAGEMISSYGLSLALNPDSTFKYRFSYANRGARDLGQDDNEGTFALKNNMIIYSPKSPRTYKYDKRIVGSGFLQTDKGLLRTLVLRGANSAGQSDEPPFIPNGRAWEGSNFWLTEEKK